MANEIRFTAEITVNNNGLSGSKSVTKQSTQTTAGYDGQVQTIPTSDTVITTVGVTTPRAIVIENRDATNYIDIGPTVSGAIAPFSRLQPGEPLMVPLYPGAVIRGIAHTASVQIAKFFIET